MADLSKILEHTCPNICKECQPQCKKWKEISNLEGPELMKYIKKHQEIARKEGGSPLYKIDFTETNASSSSELLPSQSKVHRSPGKEYPGGSKYRPEAEMTSCCIMCDTILQQISTLLCETRDILDSQWTSCNQCRLARHIKCRNCQKTGTYTSQPYSSHISMKSPKQHCMSWLTKLRHTLLAVLEVATNNMCEIYKGEPKDELEKLLQELRIPLQKYARNVSITSITKTPLSSTEWDERLVASLIENTELLKRVLAKIKIEGYKIEVNIHKANDRVLKVHSDTARLPELKPNYNIIAEPFPTSTSTPSDNVIIFPPISVQTKSEKKEYQIGAKYTKEDQSKQKTKLEKGEIKSAGTYTKEDKTEQKTESDRGELISSAKYTNDKLEINRNSTSLKQDKGKGFLYESSATKFMRDLSKERKDLEKTVTYTKNDKRDAPMRRDYIKSSLYDKYEKKSTKDTVSKDTPDNIVARKQDDTHSHGKKPSEDQKHTERKDRLRSRPKEKTPTWGSQLPSKYAIKIEKYNQAKKETPFPTKKLRVKELQSRLSTQSAGVKKSKSLIQPTEKHVRVSVSLTGKVKEKKIKGKEHDEIEIEKKKREASRIELQKMIAEATKHHSNKRNRGLVREDYRRTKGENIESNTYTKRNRIQVPVTSKDILKNIHAQKVEELRKQGRVEGMTDFKKRQSVQLLSEKQRKSREVDEFCSDKDIVECAPSLEPLEMIRGDVVVPHESLPIVKYDFEVKPLLFKVKEETANAAYSTKGGRRSDSATTLGAESEHILFDKGSLEYKLSNPKYIELGYTKLPTVSVMQKSIIYKMEQPHPEEDWFRRHIKHKILFYDSCERLAEIDADGHGRWYYKNGRMALNYCAAKEKDARNRYVVYSSGERDASGNPRCDTVLATFDHLGNGIVYDHCGNVRLKYNQNEGENFDKRIAPTGRWKWHSLNTSLQSLENIYLEECVEAHEKFIYQSQIDLMKEIDNESNRTDQSKTTADYKAQDHREMFKIEMNNFYKEKNQMQLQKYEPFQLKMKVFKLNEQFSMRIYEQRKVYLYFTMGTRNLKLNLGLKLVTSNILGTETANLREILTPFDRNISRSDSIANILEIIRDTKKKMSRKNCVPKRFYSDFKNMSTRMEEAAVAQCDFRG